MRKKIAAAAMGAALLAGGAAGAALMTPLTATAADGEHRLHDGRRDRGPEPSPRQWVTDALSKLVDDETITQAQADAVAKALEAARPAGGPGHFGRGGGPGLSGRGDGDRDRVRRISARRCRPATRSPTSPGRTTSTCRR